MTNSKRQRATCKWFSAEKGFGFLSTDDGTDIFVHWKAIDSPESFKTLAAGDEVEFETKQTSKGVQAENVRVVKPA